MKRDALLAEQDAQALAADDVNHLPGASADDPQQPAVAIIYLTHPHSF
ncbi:hypothetical protein [Streptomyces sp. HUAS TT7]